LRNPVVSGESDGTRFALTSTVDPVARTCDTRIEVTTPREGAPFAEQHRQYFHRDTDVRAALAAVGLEVTDVTQDYTFEPADPSTLLATWIVRRPA
jgi:hypothetical protein